MCRARQHIRPHGRRLSCHRVKSWGPRGRWERSSSTTSWIEARGMQNGMPWRCRRISRLLHAARDIDVGTASSTDGDSNLAGASSISRRGGGTQGLAVKQQRRDACDCDTTRALSTCKRTSGWRRETVKEKKRRRRSDALSPSTRSAPRTAGNLDRARQQRHRALSDNHYDLYGAMQYWAAAAVQRCYRRAARCALSLCLATRNRKKVSLLSLTIGLPAARWTIPVAEEEGGVGGYLCDFNP